MTRMRYISHAPEVHPACMLCIVSNAIHACIIGVLPARDICGLRTKYKYIICTNQCNAAGSIDVSPTHACNVMEVISYKGIMACA